MTKQLKQRRPSAPKTVPPKPWRLRVIRRALEKQRCRKFWTAKRWQRYHQKRATRRDQPMRPQFKVTRMAELERQRDSMARRERMLAYHARRRGDA